MGPRSCTQGEGGIYLRSRAAREGGLHTWAQQLSQHNATSSERGEIKVKRRACAHTDTKKKKKQTGKLKSSQKEIHKRLKAKKTPKEKSIYQPLRAVEINFFNVKVNK